MSQPTVTVVAELAAKPGSEEELRTLLLSILENVRKEDGCIQYDLHVNTNEPGNFVFYENWRDADALQRHATSGHMSEFRARAAEL